jgi:tetratricopeptide (TPR) repeat protein
MNEEEEGKLNYAEEMYNSGLKKMEAQDFKGAEEDFYSVINTVGSLSRITFPGADTIENLALIYRGIAFLRQGKKGQAKACFQTVLNYDKDPQRRSTASELIQQCRYS